VIGAVAHLLVPGRQRIGIILTVLIGIVGALVGGVVLADLGIAAVGTLLAAMATASRARELLLPLLFLPLAIPIVVGGVGASVSGEPGRYLA